MPFLHKNKKFYIQQALKTTSCDKNCSCAHDLPKYLITISTETNIHKQLYIFL